jgi:phage recombination protein Bet
MKARSKKKPSTRGSRRAKRAKGSERSPSPAPNTTAIVVAQSHPVVPKEEGLTRAEVELLKRTVAKGTSDDEFALFLWVARKHHLDPMTRQLHCVVRWNSSLINANGTKGGNVMTIQIGIDGYRTLAARHADYGGIDEPEIEYEEYKDQKVLKLARIRVWKKGFEHPTVGVARWAEYCPGPPNDFMWKKMPHGQLAKCAEALALRKAWPDLSDIYTDEEMEQSNVDFSASGRQLMVDGESPTSKRLAVSPQVQAQSAYHVQEVAKDTAPRPAKAPTAAAPPAIKGTIEVHWDSDSSEAAHVRGTALSQMIPYVQKDCLGVWLDKAKSWVIPSTHVHVLEEICAKLGVTFQEFTQDPGKLTTAAPTGTAAPPDTPRPPAGADQLSPSAPAHGVLNYAKPEYTANKQIKCLKVNWNGLVVAVFDQKLWPFLQEGADKKLDAELILADNKRSIVGIKRIGTRTFTEGHVPEIELRADRPKGTAGLFEP